MPPGSAFVPDNDKSGGKVLSVQTRKVKNRATLALRRAANGLHRSESSLGQFYRRMRARLGAPEAITATAHKLARIIYHLLTTRQPYDETIFAEQEARNRTRLEAWLKAQARSLGFQIIPAPTVA